MLLRFHNARAVGRTRNVGHQACLGLFIKNKSNNINKCIYVCEMCRQIFGCHIKYEANDERRHAVCLLHVSPFPHKMASPPQGGVAKLASLIVVPTGIFQD